jgi:addiction module HigA family antidote
LTPMDITPYRLAKETGIPQTRISQIIKHNRRITADTAIRFSRFFGNSVKFWLGIQDDYDVRIAWAEKKTEFDHIKALVTVDS